MGQIKHPSSTRRTRDERREAAKLLDAERNERTEKQQVKLLDKRLGMIKNATVNGLWIKYRFPFINSDSSMLFVLKVN